ncbi:hypothetical protein CCR75_009291 [Bremia lactucae]|uniref:Transmembrane protein n=1 Tax=Bremia lactucae TaxID=4779 RepID=A0A976FLJ5_BRELC|nr:hypothetical protein CCR75_009291 [Bremia lactucae]
MPKFYGAARWSPKLTLLQMLCMQCSHYAAQGLFLCVCHGKHVTLDHFFAYHTQTIVNDDGLKNCFAIVAASLVSYELIATLDLFTHLPLGILVPSASLSSLSAPKSVWTLVLRCIFLTFWRSASIRTWDWWLIHFVAATVTILLGEYLSSRRELEEIPIVDLFTKRPSRKK